MIVPVVAVDADAIEWLFSTSVNKAILYQVVKQDDTL
jgi:hypothetical protein